MHRDVLARLCITAVAFASPALASPEPTIAWVPWSASPRPLDDTPAAHLDALERDALARCGPPEAGLREAARTVLARKVSGAAPAELDSVARIQRAAGEPHPWPRVWIGTAGAPGGDAALERSLLAWLAERSQPFRRCGVAAVSAPDGARSLAVVTVDALADLAPLPTSVRTGQWLAVEARLHVRATGGRVMLLGPAGTPRTVPTSFDGSTLRARFAPDGPGEYAVQVVADVESGPRPVLEASVFVDVEPPSRETPRAAAGEDAVDGGDATSPATGGSADVLPARRPSPERGRNLDDSEQLTRMLEAARATAGLAPLARDAALDAVAREHAARMAQRHELAHDAGDGGPLERLRDAGLEPRDAAENVAHAATLALAHRAQWWSASHRANMLRPTSDRLGIGVVRDERGEPWVVEIFARLR
jgi:uncharacterized protein YkwD